MWCKKFDVLFSYTSFKHFYILEPALNYKYQKIAAVSSFCTKCVFREHSFIFQAYATSYTKHGNYDKKLFCIPENYLETQFNAKLHKIRLRNFANNFLKMLRNCKWMFSISISWCKWIVNSNFIFYERSWNIFMYIELMILQNFILI